MLTSTKTIHLTLCPDLIAAPIIQVFLTLLLPKLTISGQSSIKICPDTMV